MTEWRGRKNAESEKTYERAEKWKLRLRVKGGGGGERKKVQENIESGVR